MDSDSETKLVQAAAGGHIESFGVLYELHYSSIAALAYSILADRQLAEDAAQEVFAIACRDIGNLKSKDKFAAWLAGICRNTAKRMLRINRANTTPKLPIPSCQVDGNGNLEARINKALENLKKAERELIVLRYYDNLPYETIAKVLGVSVQAVNGRLIRTKRKMAKYLKRNGLTGDSYE